MKYCIFLSDWCFRAINKTVLAVSLVAFVLFMIFVLPNMAGHLERKTGTGISPDTSLVYSSEDLYAMAEQYGEEGRAYYIYSRYTFDLAWPAVYLAFLVSSITWLFHFLPSGSRIRLVNLLPFGAVFFDILENSSASLVLFRYPLSTPVFAQLTPVFTLLKWMMVVFSFASLTAGLFLTLYHYWKKRGNTVP